VSGFSLEAKSCATVNRKSWRQVGSMLTHSQQYFPYCEPAAIFLPLTLRLCIYPAHFTLIPNPKA
jgi:hypothetical protein